MIMMEVNIADLTWSTFIYPRGGRSEETVKVYVEALRAGATLRTWDQWNFNDCDERFGEDWPGRIPAQLIAHILYYFSNQNDLDGWRRRGGGCLSGLQPQVLVY